MYTCYIHTSAQKRICLFFLELGNLDINPSFQKKHAQQSKQNKHTLLDGGFKYDLFSLWPLEKEWVFLQVGWFNHQLVFLDITNHPTIHGFCTRKTGIDLGPGCTFGFGCCSTTQSGDPGSSGIWRCSNFNGFAHIPWEDIPNKHQKWCLEVTLVPSQTSPFTPT